jgi:hypothetical protein
MERILADFNFIVSYIPGKLNVVADCLSRSDSLEEAKNKTLLHKSICTINQANSLGKLVSSQNDGLSKLIVTSNADFNSLSLIFLTNQIKIA